MRFLSVFRRAPQHKIAAASKTPPSQYLPPASGYGVRAALAISAILLVLSSAGFGAYFAWSQAEHHGPALAVLAVAMALGLETAKPFAVEAVFDCLRRWAIGRALAMLALAIVAIGYSLTAELSLMAQTRGDATATREAAQDARGKAVERHRRAAAELAALAPSRPAGELAALLGGKDCDDHLSKSDRALCGEMARAVRRGELQAALDKAEADTVDRRAVGAGDAGAASLAVLLGLFGVTVAPGLLVTILTLIAVLALETGSALAVVLVRAMGGETRGIAPQVSKPEPTIRPSPEPTISPPVAVEIVTVPKRKGRPPIGDAPMTGAERMRRHRAKALAGNAHLN